MRFLSIKGFPPFGGTTVQKYKKSETDEHKKKRAVSDTLSLSR
jgi:hypothetical protein